MLIGLRKLIKPFQLMLATSRVGIHNTTQITMYKILNITN
jgi:hypothetical protein